MAIRKDVVPAEDVINLLIEKARKQGLETSIALMEQNQNPANPTQTQNLMTAIEMYKAFK